MAEWIKGVLIALAALVAWFARGFLANRAEEKLTTERDTAIVNAKTASIKAEARAKEADAMKKQQANEDTIHAADSDSTASRLDDLFK